MTALLTRLRIAGFKSFAEPVALDILPGLTGIVGPNGCGKSNVVEALRWAMGESSARSLRGGEMDDVIFAGTTARSSRNLAEVSITLQRGAATPLPDPFAADEELQVTRRIERGAGSHYRANGREMRARDVQTLFADLASGARSSAMVSQGRVSALVQASPEDRRNVLEEAAGITGLHARRHEAELKLRAAETNLTRAEELRTQLDTGREGLRRQARQAARYRNISALVRAAEAEFLAVLHARAQQAGEQAAAAQARAADDAAAAAQAAEHAAAALADADAALPALREEEAETRRVLERSRREAESLAREAERAQAALAEAQARRAVIHGDLADASSLEEDAGASLTRLSASAEALRARLEKLPAELALARSAAAEAAGEARLAEEAADAATSRAAEAHAASAQAALAVQQAGERAAEAAAALGEARQTCRAALAAMISPDAVAAAQGQADRAGQACDAAREALTLADRQASRTAALAEQAAAALTRESERAARAVRRVQEAETRLTRLDAALAEIARALAETRAAQIAPGRLDQARQADGEAQQALAAAEMAAVDAERAHTQAGAACLRALAQRDQLEARRHQLQAAQADARSRHQRLQDEVATSRGELARQEASHPAPEQVAAAEAALDRARAQAGTAETTWRDCAAQRQAAEHALSEARALASLQAAECARLAAEAMGTSHAAGSGDDAGSSTSLLAAIEVPAGLEMAVGALLADAPDRLEDGAGLADAGGPADADRPADTFSRPGTGSREDARRQDGDALRDSLPSDNADCPDNQAAARFWRALPPLTQETPPPGCTPLGRLVQAPAALGRALARAALLPEGGDGDALQAALAPGWVLVSRHGDLWRWDGQVCRTNVSDAAPDRAPSAAAFRLRSLARLRDIRAALALAETRDEAAAGAAGVAEASAATGREAEAAAHAAHHEALRGLAERQRALDGLMARAAEAAYRIASLRPALARVLAEDAQATTRLAEASASIDALPEAGAADPALEEARTGAVDAAAALDGARGARDAARRELGGAMSALRTLEDAAARAQNRIAGLRPQQERLALEQEEAASLHATCLQDHASCADLPALHDAADRAAAEAQEGARCLAAARRALAGAEQAAADTRQGFAALDRRDAEARMALAAAERVLAGAQAAQAREVAAQVAAAAAQTALPDPAALAEAAAQARQALAACRARAAALGQQAGAAAASLAEARAGLPAVEHELAAWAGRHQEAARRRAALAGREAEAAQACDAWAEAPLALGARVEMLGAVAGEAEAAHTAAADALRAAEARAGDAARALRQAEIAQSGCREAQARGEGRAEAARTAIAAVLARAVERLGADASLPEVTLTGAGEAEEERARRKWERLSRERDEMGPVNLRAELELSEIEARIGALDADREELVTAIAKLRGSVSHLNREGRERLREVFARVDAQFRTLFTRMMGGGRAHLALVGSDDPLEAGLEIYAEPPGKKLSALSLLSGGEQALTALSLIFAVFACTPAPVAVLDEVDAPLDDVNVERFCGLLDDVVRDTGTRFLVVTHHQLTMSRMDRLYGVTMQERGVSRLLSVDLQRAAAMVEPVMQAAE